MHRIPKIKDQARILREAFNAKGDPMDVAESLEMAARLNGFADWNAAAASEKKRPRAAGAERDTIYELTFTTWTVVHHHRHGVDSFPVYREEPVSNEEAIAIIDSEGGGYEPDAFGQEWFEVLGPERTTLKVRLSGMKALPLEQPTPGNGENTGCLEVNLVDHFEYDVPDDLPEWRWIEGASSFEHKENRLEGGIWEQMVRTDKALADPALPERLKRFFHQAKTLGCKWVLFYQD